MKLGWATDIHLNFLRPETGAFSFGEYLKKEEFDALVITGDISECHRLEDDLFSFHRGFEKPTYFILGNHDYYRGSFSEAERKAHLIGTSRPELVWLTEKSPGVELAPDTILVGQEGFYDARCGAGLDSRLMMSDFVLIDDFQPPRTPYALRGMAHPRFLGDVMREKADKEAAAAFKKLKAAAEQYPRVLFATHYPPFPKACVHKGEMSDPTWLPYFTSIAMGQVLADVASYFPNVKFTVLCGHTHSSGEYHHAPNLTVLTGESDYGVPDVYKVLDI